MSSTTRMPADCAPRRPPAVLPGSVDTVAMFSSRRARRDLPALARHGAAGVAGAVSRLDANVDHGDLARVHRGNRLREHLRKLVRLGDRPETAGALGARQPREVDLRI